MIMKFVELWEKHKHELPPHLNYFDNNLTYTDLVKLVIVDVINHGEDKFNSHQITVIDDGDYQGTLLFIIPLKTYQPTQEEYIYTFVDYGSCSGCDTLLAILGDEPEQRTKDLMTLCLRLLQNMKYLYTDVSLAGAKEK